MPRELSPILQLIARDSAAAIPRTAIPTAEFTNIESDSTVGIAFP